MIKKEPRNQVRLRRHRRVRKHISGTAERPRLSVFRSASHIYAQVIDDKTHQTLIAASSLDAEVKGAHPNGGNVEAAKAVGKLAAERAIEKGIKEIHTFIQKKIHHIPSIAIH